MPGDSAPIGRLLNGGLRLLNQVGSSPDGLLFQAQYPNGAEVTVLVLLSEAIGRETSARETYSRATRIQHANVAAVYRVGEMEDGTVYVVLEQVIGEPLSETLAEKRIFATGEAVDLALQSSAGLHAAYSAGFVHGNLSPHTIIMTPAAQGWPAVKLTGFRPASALAKDALEAPDLQEAARRYASPERLAGAPADERSEVFSLGAVFHHLLAGEPPARGQVARRVPRAARHMLETALARHPARRFQSLSEFDDALRGLASARARHNRYPDQRILWMGSIAIVLALLAGGSRLIPDWTWKATVGEGSPVAGKVSEEANARPPVQAPVAAREGARASARGGGGNRATRTPAAARTLPQTGAEGSSKVGRDTIRPPGAPQPVVAESEWAERLARMELAVREIVRKISGESPMGAERKDRQPNMPRSSGRSSRSPGNPSTTSPNPAPNRTAVAKREHRQIPEISAVQEAAGYVGDPVSDRLPASLHDSSTATDPARAVPRSAMDPRPRVELEQDQGLRQSIGDVVRLGIARDVAEVRPGSLRVYLTPDGFRVSSFMYNLQRLYLAYSAATLYHDDVELVLMQGKDLYGRFTRRGLIRTGSE